MSTISERPALVLDKVREPERRKLVRLMGAAMEGPRPSAGASSWLPVVILLALLFVYGRCGNG